MARFSRFTSHISLLIVVSLSLAIHISIVSSSSPSPLPAPFPQYPEVEYVSTEYHPSSFEAPSPDETEYLSPPVYPPLGVSLSSESPPPEIDGYSEALISPTTTFESPEEPPLTSPLSSPPDEAPILPTPSTSPPPLSTEDNVESSLESRSEDEDSEADLWPDHQVTSSMPYKSSSSNSNDGDSVVYAQKPEKQPEEENEDSGKGRAGKGGVGFGVAMGVCMVGLGGFVYMKRRKGNDVRGTRSYMQLAERRSLI
ncbi:hypothetical protein ACJRO7_001217 [Eucalyptus globulus]|uniref:Uncharacterized protein n=1 Tax=Eucalyptus globulus TaxID=34317 RepID=A0ABD3LQ79_EUCGL